MSRAMGTASRALALAAILAACGSPPVAPEVHEVVDPAWQALRGPVEMGSGIRFLAFTGGCDPGSYALDRRPYGVVFRGRYVLVLRGKCEPPGTPDGELHLFGPDGWWDVFKPGDRLDVTTVGRSGFDTLRYVATLETRYPFEVAIRDTRGRLIVAAASVSFTEQDLEQRVPPCLPNVGAQSDDANGGCYCGFHIDEPGPLFEDATVLTDVRNLARDRDKVSFTDLGGRRLLTVAFADWEGTGESAVWGGLGSWDPDLMPPVKPYWDPERRALRRFSARYQGQRGNPRLSKGETGVLNVDGQWMELTVVEARGADLEAPPWTSKVVPTRLDADLGNLPPARVSVMLRRLPLDGP